MTSWIRIEATRLSPRGFDGRFIFQLSEVLVFNGQDISGLAMYQRAALGDAAVLAPGAPRELSRTAPV